MPEEAFGSQPPVLIFSLLPYSRFWGCRVIEPVYPDDSGEVIKRSHQLAPATRAVPSEAFSPAGSYLPEKIQREVNAGTSAGLSNVCGRALSPRH